jgi:hypothetical protein
MAEITASNKPLTAKSLSNGLKDSGLKERLEGKRTMYIEMEYGKPPTVKFDGFWNAMFIKGAFNSISKAYRVLRAKPGDKRYLDKGGSK